MRGLTIVYDTAKPLRVHTKDPNECAHESITLVFRNTAVTALTTTPLQCKQNTWQWHMLGSPTVTAQQQFSPTPGDAQCIPEQLLRWSRKRQHMKAADQPHGSQPTAGRVQHTYPVCDGSCRRADGQTNHKDVSCLSRVSLEKCVRLATAATTTTYMWTSQEGSKVNKPPCALENPRSGSATPRAAALVSLSQQKNCG